MHHSRAGRRGRIVLNDLVICVLLTLPLGTAFAADDYLSSLEAEAEKTTVLQKARAEQEKLMKAKAQPEPDAAGEPAAAEPAPKAGAGKDAREQFELALFREFPGNYAVYTSLSPEQKATVFQTYSENSGGRGLQRFGPALGKILELASQ